MARVTIEDCLPRVSGRFELVIVASLRAKDIVRGLPLMIKSTKNEKSTILALREIAAGSVDSSYFYFRDNILDNIDHYGDESVKTTDNDERTSGSKANVRYKDEEKIDG